MQIYHGHEEARGVIAPCILVIGNFDGIHLGHLSLIERARELALQMNVSVALYTFWPHPQSVLRPQSAPLLLCTRKQKLRILKECGVETLIEEPFTLEFASRSAQSFVEDILGDCIKPLAVVTGENFHFGNRALGTPEKMGDWLKPLGISYEMMPSLRVNGLVCSSSQIRELIRLGLVVEAAGLLGREYSIIGEVIKGAGRGRTIGIPTANLKPDSELVPASGVYSTRVRVGNDSTLYAGATNIGTRPTFSGLPEISVETHILGFEGNVYGQELEIFFIKKLRDERKFASAEELVSQIRKDIETARTVTPVKTH